jgi:hypothetical protein
MKRAIRLAGEAVAARVSGERPGAVRSVLVAMATGSTVAALTYKVLRSERLAGEEED